MTHYASERATGKQGDINQYDKDLHQPLYPGKLKQLRIETHTHICSKIMFDGEFDGVSDGAAQTATRRFRRQLEVQLLLGDKHILRVIHLYLCTSVSTIVCYSVKYKALPMPTKNAVNKVVLRRQRSWWSPRICIFGNRNPRLQVYIATCPPPFSNLNGKNRAISHRFTTRMTKSNQLTGTVSCRIIRIMERLSWPRTGQIGGCWPARELLKASSASSY